MSGVAPVQDRIKTEYAVLVDNFANLVKSAKVSDHSESTTPGTVPAEILDVFVEKMIISCRQLLAISSDLKRNALLNDVSTRNREIRETRDKMIKRDVADMVRDWWDVNYGLLGLQDLGSAPSRSCYSWYTLITALIKDLCTVTRFYPCRKKM